MIEINPPLCRLVDMKSHNGTLVNGVRVPSADLKNGDLIQAGHTVLRVTLQGAEAPPGSAARPTVPEPMATLTDPAGTAASVPLAQPLSAAPNSGTPVVAPAVKTEHGTEPPMALPVSVAVSNVPVAQFLTTPDTGKAPMALPVSAVVAKPVEGLPTIPGYELVRELGRGGMGVVYQARCLADGALAAVKTILPAVKPSEVTLGRFLREANILRALEHPNIVRFRDLGRSGEQLYFAMDFVPGTDAGRLLKEHGPLPLGRAARLICQLLAALEYAHAKGYVHRDIKPGNLLVGQEQGKEIARLADFGLARTYQASQLSGLTMTGSAGGTAGFMPPEQVIDFRTVKPAADQYAAAAALYHLLCGRPLYEGSQSALDLMLMILQQEPVSLRTRRPDLPAPLAAAVDRALSRKPEDRFSDVSAFRRTLLPYAAP
jgi:serine/threonine-protein kinase